MARWEDIAAALRDDIRRFKMGVGDRLPPERELAVRFEAARNTVRQAVKSLEQDGTVSRRKGSGTFVQQPVSASDELLRQMIGVSPRDLMDVRMVVEPSAAAMAAIHASNDELRAIEEAHRAATVTLDMEPFERWDAELHRRIFIASQNQLLVHINDLLGKARLQRPWMDLKRRAFSPARRDAYCDQHERLVRALHSRDGNGASEAMRTHLAAVKQALIPSDL